MVFLGKVPAERKRAREGERLNKSGQRYLSWAIDPQRGAADFMEILWAESKEASEVAF